MSISWSILAPLCRWLRHVALVVLGLGALAVGAFSRTPYFLFFRETVFVLSLVGGTIGLLAGIHVWRKRGLRAPATTWFLLVGLVIGACLTTTHRLRHERDVRFVLEEADPAAVRAVGRHFVIGVRDWEEALRYVRRGAVG